MDGIESGILTDKEVSRIYGNNFEELVVIPSIDVLENNGFNSMLDNVCNMKDKKLPVPENFHKPQLRHIDAIVSREYYLTEHNDNLKDQEAFIFSRKYLASMLFSM